MKHQQIKKPRDMKDQALETAFYEDYKRFIVTMRTSMLCMDLKDITLASWDETTCQDVLHSIHRTRIRLSGLAEMHINRDRMMPNTHLYGDITNLISKQLRPLELRWHSIFFKNIQFNGLDVTSEPVPIVPVDVRDEFKSGVIHVCAEARKLVGRIEEYADTMYEKSLIAKGNWDI